MYCKWTSTNTQPKRPVSCFYCVVYLSAALVVVSLTFLGPKLSSQSDFLWIGVWNALPAIRGRFSELFSYLLHFRKCLFFSPYFPTISLLPLPLYLSLFALLFIILYILVLLYFCTSLHSSASSTLSCSSFLFILMTFLFSLIILRIGEWRYGLLFADPCLSSSKLLNGFWWNLAWAECTATVTERQ